MAKEEQEQKSPTMWTEELLRDYFYIMDMAFTDPNVEAEIARDMEIEALNPDLPSGPEEEEEDEEESVEETES